MTLRATLLAGIGLLALPVQAQNIDAAEITTSTVTSIVFNNGNIGGDCTGAQQAYVFNGDEGLCSSGFLVGFAEDDVVGNSYFLTDETEWSPVGPAVTGVASPYADFPSGVQVAYENTTSNLSVIHSAYFGDVIPDVVLHEIEVTNTGAVALDDVYMGIHHDWDVGGGVFASNLAARDGSTLYAWDPTGATGNYFGYSLLGVELSGWRYETTFAGSGQTNEINEADLWNGMTMMGDDTAPNQDQRLVSGAGPYAIPAGGSVVFQALAAAGVSEDDLLLNVALAESSLMPATVTSASFSTSTVTGSVFNNGNIGGECDNDGDGFAYNGDDALCGAGFLVGFNEDNTIGDAYLLDETTEWSPLGAIEMSMAFPYPDFDNGLRLRYVNEENSISVEQNVYTGETYPDVALHVFDVTNYGTEDQSGVYIGAFHDYDIGGAAAASNGAFRDGSTIYVTDPTGVSTNVFGVAILGAELSGWDYFINYPGGAGEQQSEGELFVGLSEMSVEGDSAPQQDQRVVQGAGPFDIAAGETVQAVVAFAAGDSVADLLMNVGDVSQAIGVAGDASPTVSLDRVSAPAPNPTSGTSRVTVSLDGAESVRVTVTDVLGRTVATLHDGALAAGQTALTLDASRLAPGVYVVRADGESFRQTRTLTVVR